MTSNIYITPSTTLVLLKNLSTPVVIYLSSLQAPNFFVTIRDTTGLSSIQQTPVRISTIGGALFKDGTSLYNLDQPYGLVNLGLQNSTIWHFKHTSGQKPATAAATVETVLANLSYFSFLSSVNKFTSTLVVHDLDTLNPISFTGNANLLGISIASSIVIQNSGISFGPVAAMGPVTVIKEATFFSSITTPFVSTFQQSLYVLSSLSSGGNLYVGGNTIVTTSIQLASTVQVQTLQVRTSTIDTVLRGITQVAGLFSTLGSVVVDNEIRVQKTAFVGANLSTQGSLYGGSNLTIQNSSLFLSTTSVTFAGFFSTTSLQSSLLSMSSITVYSTASFHDSTMTASFTTPSLYTASNLQIQGFTQTSSLRLLSTLSTLFLQGSSSISVMGDFTSFTSIISFSTLSVPDDIRVLRNATFQFISIGKDLIVGGSTFIGSSISTGSGLFSAELTASTLEVKGPATLNGNLYVSSVILADQLIVGQDVTLFGLNSNPLLFNTLRTTSVSTPLLNVSSILSTGYLYITNSNYRINTVSTYISTLTTPQIVINTGLAKNVTTDLFDLTPIEGQEHPYTFRISSSTYFIQGLSSLFLSTVNIVASTMYGAFIGDANAISNINNSFIPDKTSFSSFALSYNSSFYTSLSSYALYTSSFTFSENTLDKGCNVAFATSSINVFSSLTTTGFRIDSPGTPFFSTVHQILNVTPSDLVINRTLFLNKTSTLITQGTNTGGGLGARYTLDISGLLYVTELTYSSIQVFDINQISTQTNVDGGNTSSLTVSDSLRTVALAFIISDEDDEPFSIKGLLTYTPTLSNTQGSLSNIVATPSSLVLNNSLYIQNRRCIIDPLTEEDLFRGEQLFTGTTNSLVTLNGSVNTTELKTSTLDVTYKISTTNLFFSTLALYNGNDYEEEPYRNSFQIFTSTLAINSTLFFHTGYNVLGINTLPDPSTFMRVNSNAFFSTLTGSDLRAGSISYSFQTL
jgi:hypothetical protein